MSWGLALRLAVGRLHLNLPKQVGGLAPIQTVIRNFDGELRLRTHKRPPKQMTLVQKLVTHTNFAESLKLCFTIACQAFFGQAY